MQIISNDKTVRNDTIGDLKEFNSQSSTTQATKGQSLVSVMSPIKLLSLRWKMFRRI